MSDVVTTEPHAIAGASVPLVNTSHAPAALADVRNGETGEGLTTLSSFPHFGTPFSGFNVPAKAPVVFAQRLPPNWIGSVVPDIGEA
jgi:hypothetical protein